MSWCPEGAFLVLVLLAVAACGEREREAAGPAQPDDDPAHGVYNYDDARDLGIRVDPVPPADQLCPVGITDDGLSAEELDTHEELAALDQGMATAPTCTVDPRLGLIGLGYSVEAVRAAPNAVEKGKLVCGGGAPSIPASLDASELDRLARERLRAAYGVEPSDSIGDLIAGCRTTSWGATMLLPE